MALQVWLPLTTNPILTNQYDTTIYTEPDGSNWVRLFHHNNPVSNGLFSSSDNFNAPLYKDANRWFNCQLLNNITKSSWELMVKQKTTSDATETKYRWIQYVNPYEANFSNTKAESITKITSSGYSTVANAGGMYKINNNTYFCINNATSGNWFGAIGSWGTYNTNQVPGYPNTSISSGYMDLYLRLNDDDNLCRNLGASGVKFIKSGSLSVGIGKVTSKCMTSPNPSSSSATAFVYTTSTFKYTKNFSVSVWVKLPSANSSYASYIATEGRADGTQYGWGLQGNATSLTARFGNGSNAKSSLTANTWHLATFTVDNSSKCSFYVDGVLNGSFTPSTLPTYAQDNGIGIGLFRYSSGNIYQWNGSINDFRLYNHCLSIKEIKNLAKGLMLHYTLSRPQANLLKNTATEKSWTYSGTSYSDSNYSQETITPASGSYYTMSFDAKSNRNSTSNFITYLYNNNSGRQCDSVKGYIDGQLVYTGSASDGACVMPTYTYYRHYVIVRHFNTNATALTKQNVFRISNSGSTALTMYVKNAKIELGDKSTPWIPNSADTLYSQMGFNRNIEDDVSGYNNNGTRTNINTWNTDTARYLSSMTFNGSNGYICLPKDSARPKDAITISVWAYMSDWSTYNGRLCSCTEGGGWNFEPSSSKMSLAMGTGSSSNTYKSIASTKTLAQLGSGWHHFVGTYDGLSVKIYIDGVLEGTNNAYTTATPIFYANNYTFIGAEAGGNTTTPAGNPFNGRMSDFRIYATALSADDVKELYNVGASIDKNGNMHCYELVESL